MQSHNPAHTRNERPSTPDPGPDTDTGVLEELDWQLAEDTGGKGIVLLHNDDVTPYDFVVGVMQTAFGFPWLKAVAVTQTAHTRGIALVGIYPLEEAKYKVGQAHAMARTEGYPLTLTIEPEET
jgi:ATP-dependent Clp protease adaptor protein ClpS